MKCMYENIVHKINENINPFMSKKIKHIKFKTYI